MAIKYIVLDIVIMWFITDIHYFNEDIKMQAVGIYRAAYINHLSVTCLYYDSFNKSVFNHIARNWGGQISNDKYITRIDYCHNINSPMSSYR